MKFNWGTGIALFYTCFAGMMIFFVIKSKTYDHSLVQDDYYAADLAYQERYDKMVNEHQENLQIEYNDAAQELTLHFPTATDEVEGNVLFFRPSNSKEDRQIALNINEQQQRISTQELSTGLWKLKVDWSANGKAYYKEMTLVL